MPVGSSVTFNADVVRAELVSSIQALVENTEEVFLSLATEYPRLLSEMDESLEAAARLVRCFDGAEHNAEIDLKDGLQSTTAIIQSAVSEFESMHGRDRELYASLDSTIDRLGGLSELIERVREDSIEMELVSLNAMTVALKSGTAGRAFSYITEELKRLSTRTIGLTEQITDRGVELGKEFADFRSALAEIRSFQQSLFDGLQTRLNASFDEIKAAIDQVVGSLREVCRTASSVREPLNEIMEGIQFQDLIRQSLDHVIIGVNELPGSESIEDPDEMLDELTFLQKLPELCTSVLDDVSIHISSSLARFRKNSKSAAQLIQEAEMRRAELVRQALDGGDKQDSLANLFTASTAMLQDLLGDLQHSMRMKSEVGQRAASISKTVQSINENFNAFAALVTRFHSIDVASRIEVAKQAVLQQMSGTVNEMNSLTRRIDADVDQSLSYTKTFIADTSSTIAEFEAVSATEERFVEEFTARMNAAYEELYGTNERVVATLGGFSLFTESFVRMFERSQAELDRLESLIDRIESIKGSLARVRSETEAQMKTMLEERGLSEWRIENRKLQEIIKRFTIFTHKKTAAELGGFDVEAGQDSGEVTLF